MGVKADYGKSLYHDYENICQKLDTLTSEVASIKKEHKKEIQQIKLEHQKESNQLKKEHTKEKNELKYTIKKQ